MPPPPTDGGMSVDMAVVPVGAACHNDGECGRAGLFCALTFANGRQSIPIPGGYCTMDCSNGNVCPAGSSCASFAFGHYCLSQCPPDPCRSGYVCCTQPVVRGCSVSALCNGGD
jgi:hypothetical protein